MDKEAKKITEDKFHEILHLSIDKPVKNYRKKWSQNRKRRVKVHNGAHRAYWSKAIVLPLKKKITIDVFLNYKKNNLSDIDYAKLKRLASEGISQYWSRDITIDGDTFLFRLRLLIE